MDAATIGITFGFASMLLFGIANFVAGIYAKRYDPIMVLSWYFSSSSVILLVVALAFFRIPHVSPGGVVELIGAAIASAAGIFFFYRGLGSGNISVVVPVASAYTVPAVIISVIVLGETLGAMQIAGICAAILGTILIGIKFGSIHKSSGPLSAGIGSAVLTLFIWGAFYPLIGFLSESMGWIWPVLVSSVGTAAIFVAYGLATRRDMRLPRRGSIGIFAYAWTATTAFALYSIGAGTGNIALVAAIAAAAPLITVVLAMLLLKERMEPIQVAGLALIIIGLVAISAFSGL